MAFFSSALTFQNIPLLKDVERFPLTLFSQVLHIKNIKEKFYLIGNDSAAPSMKHS